MKSPRLVLALAWAQILAVGFAAGVVAFALWTLWSQALGRLSRAAVIAEVRANPLRPIEEPAAEAPLGADGEEPLELAEPPTLAVPNGPPRLVSLPPTAAAE